MSFQSWPDKDPDEVLDYEIDWTSRLGSDTIATSTWTVPTGLTSASNSSTTTTATIWLSGGTTGTTYRVLNEITTAGGRTMDQTVTLKIADK
jgi:hypothetical protein